MLSQLPEVNAAFPWFFPGLVFVLGTMVGSFLNVCIYRIPADKSVVTPRSHCACGKPIAWFDNIPVLSWFLLRGKARCCGRPYSFRYVFVEALTGALFLACWLLKTRATATEIHPGEAVCGWVLLAALVAATFIDLDHFIIPDRFTIGLGFVGVTLSLLVPALHGESPGPGEAPLLANFRSGGDAVVGLLVGAGLVAWIAGTAEAVLKKEAMGFGDVKLVGAIGAFTGWQGAVFSVFGGAVVGTVWVALAWAWQKISGKKSVVAPTTEITESGSTPPDSSRRGALALPAETADGQPTELGMGAQVPFGPMLAIAGALHFLWLHGWMADYVRDTLQPLFGGAP
jgi:leader peptidase (prepilin peptidase)/N-methyltransferase